MKVYEVLAEAFAAEGVTDVFGMMGDANMFWIDRLAKLGVTTYEVRHESAAINMAQAYTRISGKVGVATTTSGPGVTQLATSLTIAARASAPIVAYCGESPTGDDEYVQRVNVARFAEATESGFLRINTPDEATEAVRKAFYQAKYESRPVILSVPMDVQQKPAEDDAMEDYRTSDALLRPQRPRPDPELLEHAVELIAASRRPVILVGRGAMASGAGDAIRDLAARTGALIATSLMAKNWLNDDDFHAGISGTYATRTAMELFQDADLVIGIGAGLNKHTTANGYLFPMAKVIHVDKKPHVVPGSGLVQDLYLQADARLAVEAFERELAARGCQNEGYRTSEVRARLAEAYDDPEEYEIQPGTVDPREVCLMLDKLMPSNVGLVLGSGQNVCFSTMLFNEPRELLLPNQFFGSIGQGLTSTFGAIVGSGRKPAFLMDGDVSLMMYLSEFETAVRYGLPLLVIVLNDQAMGAELHKMRVKGLDADLASLTTPNLGKVAEALGGRGALARTLDDVKAAAQGWLADPVPTIIDVRISDNVISIPYRRLHYGQDA
jgi:acetolactate synthase-1/2/3 large subunit